MNGDGANDVIAGPFWYEGPDFERVHEFAEVVIADPLAYSDDFFVFVLDLDRDGRQDIFKVGFPGKDAFWYRNPGQVEGHWQKHTVFTGVDNESPMLTDIDGDGFPELVCNHGGAFGYASANASAPHEPWTFHAISPDLGKQRFTHGLGVADVNGDGRVDVLEAGGWFEQPAQLAANELWTHHPFAFTTRGGGAQMYAYDIDGDGDQDVLTSLFAHGFGLSWFEQVRDAEGTIDFVEHLIMDLEPEANPYGVRFSALHALDVADVDGDGLLDLVTGKRHWSHGPKGDPGPQGPSVLYWFRLERRAEGARFVPHLIDEHSGVGTQVVAGDIDGDGRCDVVVGNKAGIFVHLQSERGVSIEEPPRFAAQPKQQSVNERNGERARGADGRELNLGFESGDLSDWTQVGNAFAGQPVRGDKTAQRGLDSSKHVGEYWIGGYEIHGDGRVGELVSVDFEVAQPWASFLVAGGRAESTRVEIVSSAGEVIFSTPGPNYEPLLIAVVDLREHVGERIHIRLVDEEKGGWGHINFDDFLFHAEEPAVEPELRMFAPDKTKFSGLTPAEAARAMTVPDGFHVDLIAAEPDLHQPVALAIDHKGRLWVAEAHTYPVRKPDGEGTDLILVFEDEDHDGSFEKRTIFADGLNLVSGLEVGHGGVWIGAAPYLMFIADGDDDLVPDGEPEILLDGWAYQDTHETLNAFAWGPDGWLYGCHGVFTHSRVAAPGTPDAERQPINAGVWRFHPSRREFEVFAWGTSNPWGVDFDEHGQAFITACVIPHLYHMVQGGRYERQAGSHFDAHPYSEIVTIADHRHYQGDSPHGGNNRSSAAGGGHAHCGALIYLGESFPEEYRGRIFMNNIHGNRINSDSMERSGSGFIGHHEQDLVLANDAWFRGINMKQGPDGAVYFIDWYDERACHSQAPEVWDRTNGRLYRLRYGAAKPIAVDLKKASDAKLVRLATGRDEWSARRARVELQAREEPKVREALLAILREKGEATTQLRALWTGHACGIFGEEELIKQTRADDEYLAAWAVQLLCEPGDEVSKLVRQRLVRLAKETQSPVVRLYLASALQRIGPDFELARALCESIEDDGDPNLATVLWYALEAHVRADPKLALKLAATTSHARLRSWIVRRAAAEEATRTFVVEALEAAMKAEDEREWMDLLLAELDQALRDSRGVRMPAAWSGLYSKLAQLEREDVRDQALWIAAAFGDESALPRMAEILLDDSLDLNRRSRALEVLAASKSALAGEALRNVLDEIQLRPAAIRGLAASSDPKTATALLRLYPELDGGARADVLATLSSRVPFALALLAAVEAGELPQADLTAFVLRKLRALQSEEVDDRLAAVWGVFREPDKDKSQLIADTLARFAEQQVAVVRPANGRRVFDATCGKCHTLFGVGGQLGPDLTGSNRADLEYLLTNILDPNAIIGRDYQVTIVRTFDGLLVTGVLQKESESSLTLATETDEYIVAKDDIEERVLSDVSVMPEGQADTLSEADLRDLLAYLAQPEQVVEVVAEPSADALFNGTDLAGWSGEPDVWSVEDGAIVGRTAGLGHNSFLRNELELGDFKLRFEVLLVNDEGNSGVQFRSRELDGGEVAGYQADIGPDWWGKLYEENGRALLWSDSAEDAVRPGEWNEYAIEARGSRIRTWINGRLSVELDDPLGARSGRIALQVHSGGATDVRFRNFKLER